MKASDFDHCVSETDLAGADSMRIDQYLSRKHPDISRSQWAKRVDEGSVLVDGKAVSPAHKLKAGQKLSLEEKARPVPTAPSAFEGPEPEVLFEDASLLVINKPAGLTVHAGSGVGTHQTLVGWLLSTRRIDPSQGDMFEEERPGIVHRLDRGTSGVLVVAKNVATHEKLARQFAERTAERFYWAVVDGHIKALFEKRPHRVDALLNKKPSPIALRLQERKVSTFVSFLDRDTNDRTRFRVSNGAGKKAITHFIEISSCERQSLIELKLGTGRTHQIRVHLAFLGFPILGDGLYGGRGHERTLLHAHLLRFDHPIDGRRMEISAPWPKSVSDWLTREGLKAETRQDLWQELAAGTHTDSNSDSDKDGLED